MIMSFNPLESQFSIIIRYAPHVLCIAHAYIYSIELGLFSELAALRRTILPQGVHVSQQSILALLFVSRIVEWPDGLRTKINIKVLCAKRRAIISAVVLDRTEQIRGMMVRKVDLLSWPMVFKLKISIWIWTTSTSFKKALRSLTSSSHESLGFDESSKPSTSLVATKTHESVPGKWWPRDNGIIAGGPYVSNTQENRLVP